MGKYMFIGPVRNSAVKSGPELVLTELHKNFRVSNEKVWLVSTAIQDSVAVFALLKAIAFLIVSRGVRVNVHSSGLIIPLFFALWGRVDFKNDYFLTMHGVTAMDADRATGVNLLLERLLVVIFPSVICVSNLQKSALSKLFNRKRNVFVIHNGVEECVKYVGGGFKPGGVIRVISAAGFSVNKLTKQQISMVKAINSGGKRKILLDIYGGGSDAHFLSEFKERESAYNTEGIYYRGLVDTNELLKKYEQYDFCLCISKWETFNQTALQAMRAGTPAIVCRTVGAVELISNGESGFVVDIDCLAKSMDEIMVIDSARYSKMAKQAHRIAGKQRWENVAKKYEEVMDFKV
jgi:Glycosyltransferase